MMNNLEFEQFKVQAKKRHIEHEKYMSRGRTDKFDYIPLLDRMGIVGQERAKFLATQDRIELS